MHLGISLGVPLSPGVALNKGPGEPAWLLRDDFLTDEAAPIASPRTCEPGPGTLTAMQFDAALSISGESLVIPNHASAGWGEQGWYLGAMNRFAGRTLYGLGRRSVTGYGNFVAWLSTNSLVGTETGGRAHAIYDQNAGLDIIDGASKRTVGPLMSLNTDYEYAIVLRTSGAYYFARGGVFANWTLLWVDVSVTTTPIYAGGHLFSGAWEVDTLRVLDLAGGFETDYGIATSRLAGNRTAGNAFTHEADCIIEFTIPTLQSSGTTVIAFRYVDAGNHLRVAVPASGTIRLYEVVGGVVTERGTALSGGTAGMRVVIVAEGSTVRTYRNGTAGPTYSSFNTGLTETDGVVQGIGTDGTIADIVAWPRIATGDVAAQLNLLSS